MQTSSGYKTAIELLRGACPAGGLVVDAGAFPGNLTRLIKADGWDVLALDIKPDQLLDGPHRFVTGASLESTDGEVTFRQAMEEIGVEVRAVDLEVSPFPVESESVDAVVLTEVIEHLWVDPLFALAEINRILRESGILLVSTPNLLSIRNRFNFLRGRMDRVIIHPVVPFIQKSRLGYFGHLRLYAPAELSSMLSLMGFEPRTHFYSINFWEGVSHEPRMADGLELCRDKSASDDSPKTARRSIIRKLIRSPRSYFSACVATTRVALEKMVPSYRPHMFVVAKKVRYVDHRELSLADIKSAITDENSSYSWLRPE